MLACASCSKRGTACGGCSSRSPLPIYALSSAHYLMGPHGTSRTGTRALPARPRHHLRGLGQTPIASLPYGVNQPLGPSTDSALPGITWQNLVMGTLSPAQQAALQAQEAAALVKASGGVMSPADAAAQAQSDVTQAVAAAGAAPTSGFTLPDLTDFSQASTWLVWGGIGIVGLLALRGLR